MPAMLCNNHHQSFQTEVQKNRGCLVKQGCITTSFLPASVRLGSLARVALVVLCIGFVPADAEVSMRKSVTASISTAFVLYLLVSSLCYLALGDSASGMVLTSFHTAAPWATVLGNALVLGHMVSAFQLFCQPMFAAMEARMARQWPRLDGWAESGKKRLQLIQLGYRGVYVGLLTVVALLFPFL